MGFEKSQGFDEYMARDGGEKERALLRYNSRMERFELQRYTGMRLLASVEWNSRSNTLWIK